MPLILVTALGACAGGTPIDCAPVAQAVSLTGDVAGLAGAYDLIMIATEGPERGDTARGTLRLAQSAAERRAIPGIGGAPDANFHAPLYGSVAIDVRAVGALAVGTLDTDDEASPGVLLIERMGDQRSILLRLGSGANVRDRQPAFDGPYTVLQVGAMSSEGFRGTWRSGSPTTDAEGYFCAVKQEP